MVVDRANVVCQLFMFQMGYVSFYVFELNLYWSRNEARFLVHEIFVDHQKEDSLSDLLKGRTNHNTFSVIFLTIRVKKKDGQFF